MTVFETFAIAILGNATLLAVLGWLAKILLEKIIARDSKRFEIELKAKADTAIEEYKSKLQFRTLEHQIRYSKHHEKRATTIAELNALLAELMWEAENFLSVLEFSGEPSKKDKYYAAMSKMTDFFRYFDKNKIYLPAKLCAPLQDMVLDVRQHVIKFGTYVQLEQREPLQSHTEKDKLEAWSTGWTAIRTKIPAVRAQLEDEFRLLLEPTYA